MSGVVVSHQWPVLDAEAVLPKDQEPLDLFKVVPVGKPTFIVIASAAAEGRRESSGDRKARRKLGRRARTGRWASVRVWNSTGRDIVRAERISWP